MLSKFLFFFILLAITVTIGKEQSDCQKQCDKHFDECDYKAKTRSQHGQCEEKRGKCYRECKKLEL